MRGWTVIRATLLFKMIRERISAKVIFDLGCDETRAYLGEQCSPPREQKMQKTRREQMSCRVRD